MRRVGLVAVVMLLAAAGCGSKDPAAAPPVTTPSVTGTAGATPNTSPAPGTPGASASDLLEFTVDGAGPYQLGATLANLQATASLDEVKTGGEVCPQNATARGKGVWKDIRLSFRNDGVLYLAINRSPSIPTPSGAWLGTTLAQLKSIYNGVTTQTLTRGGGNAFLVITLSGRGILFDLDPSKRVIAMIAGDAVFLRTSYLGGTDFC